MRADYRVVLDACVLIPMPLADTLLRMAEEPRLYLPRWSQMITGAKACLGVGTRQGTRLGGPAFAPKYQNPR
jgi:hypothetical protein